MVSHAQHRTGRCCGSYSWHNWRQSRGSEWQWHPPTGWKGSLVESVVNLLGNLNSGGAHGREWLQDVSSLQHPQAWYLALMHSWIPITISEEKRINYPFLCGFFSTCKPSTSLRRDIIKLVKIAALEILLFKTIFLNRYFNLCYNTDAKKPSLSAALLTRASPSLC